MKQLNYFSLIILLFVASFGVVSCKKNSEKRDGVGTGTTDLQVYVLNSESNLVSGAVVNLYTSESARDAESGAIKTYVTSGNGIGYFGDLEVLKYYVSVRKTFENGDVKIGKSDTGISIKEKEESAITITLP